VKSIHFILGVHNHQPVGNFDSVFEEAYQKAYLPFLKTLAQHPSIRLMYHTTGPLLDWLGEHHPDYFDRLKTMIERGQLEIMTGGYYEPILAVLPDRDKSGQINMMSRFISERMGVHARGLWLAERVWEPHLAKPLAESGVEFVTLDDYHFHSAGMDPDELLGYYRTDEQGYGIAVFPINMRLRYLIPFAQPEETIAYLRDKTDESGGNLLVMADDGEKFGLWPGTHEWVHRKGWLKRFFQQLESAMKEGWLKMTTCGQYLDSHPPRGRVYLPCASYFEMSAWSLPPGSGARFDEIVHRFDEEKRMDELRPYLKGGFWRNFLAKYDESNRMYRKMLWVSDQVVKADTSIRAKDSKLQRKLESARMCLYRAQCNCAYWHGVFGGLYLPHLRHAVYLNLLEAEDLCNQITHSDDHFVEIEKDDFDSISGEVHLRNERVGVMISPREGGAIYEFDYLPARFNLLNTLHRQLEAYHQRVAGAGGEISEGTSIHDQLRSKEQGLARYLVYDQHLRGALVDHFLSAEETPQSLQEGRYSELGDFVAKPYEIEQKGELIQLRRTGSAVDNRIEVRKSLSLSEEQDGLQIGYHINNLSRIALNILFAPEFNFALLAGNFAERYYYQDDHKLDHAALNSTGISRGVRRFSLFNESDKFAVHFDFKKPTEVWRYPVETISQSEEGFERIYQSSCVMPVFRLAVAGGGRFRVRFRIVIASLS